MAGDEKDGFSATAWTIVEQAAEDRAALNALLRRYWRPLWVHLIYAKRFSESEADDVVQEFITSRILERDLLARVDRHKGKFRSFLLKSLDRFLIDRYRSHAAAKAAPLRAGSFDEGFDPASKSPAPDAAFESGWAISTLAEAVRRMEAECQSAMRPDLWRMFEGRAGTILKGEAQDSYAVLASRLVDCDEKQAANLWGTAQAKFKRILGQTLADFGGGNLEQDLIDLTAVMNRCRGELLEAVRSKLWPALPTVSAETSTPTHLDPTLLASIWETESNREANASEQWQALLAQTIPSLSQAESSGRPGMIGELLSAARPDGRALNAVKAYAKDLRASSIAGPAAEAATGLYYATLATAISEGMPQITDQRPEALVRGLTWLAAQPWIDPAIQQRATAAIERLSESL